MFCIKKEYQILTHKQAICLILRYKQRVTSYSRNYEFGVVATHNRELYMYNCNDKFIGGLYDMEVDKYIKNGYNIIKAQEKALSILKGYDFQCVKK